MGTVSPRHQWALWSQFLFRSRCFPFIRLHVKGGLACRSPRIFFPVGRHVCYIMANVGLLWSSIENRKPYYYWQKYTYQMGKTFLYIFFSIYIHFTFIYIYICPQFSCLYLFIFVFRFFFFHFSHEYLSMARFFVIFTFI